MAAILLITRILLLSVLAWPVLSGCHQANDGRTAGESESITSSDSEHTVADRFSEGGEGVPGVATPITGANLTIASVSFGDTRVVHFETSISGIDHAIAFDAASMTALGVKVISWSFSNLPSKTICEARHSFEPICTGAVSLANSMIRAKLKLVFASGGVVFGESPKVMPTPICPAGYVVISGNPAVGVGKRFCVMKYEAKKLGNAVVSVPEGQPIDDANLAAAQAMCKALGAGSEVISNAEWQTIARDIESVPQNWSGGIVGSGSLNIGNADNVWQSQVADRDDANGCFGISASVPVDCGGHWHRNNRVHILKNGEQIWDISGNNWEWVKDNNTASEPGNNNYISQLSASDVNKEKYLPLGNYESLTQDPRAGLGYFWNSAAGGIIRGGATTGGDKTGPFAVNLTLTQSYVSTPGDNRVGFRCRKEIP